MQILIIGGTQFVGRAVCEAALARGHEVTLFHRGKTNPGLFGEKVQEILGDRKEDVSGLAGRHWDAVIDCVGYEPGTVAKTCEAVQTDRYAFISTVSVYDDPEGTEDTPTIPMPEGASLEVMTGATYGPLKVLCEEVIQRTFPKSLLIRAGLQMGPYDHTDRLSEWIERLMTRPRVAVADDDASLQVIDTADMANFILHCLENEIYGVYNVTGEVLPLRSVIETMRDAVAPDTELVPVSPAAIQEVCEPWQEFTLWMTPEARAEAPFRVSTERAKAAGLTLRPLSETFSAIAERLRTLPADRPRRGGLPLDKEQQLLALGKPE